MAHACKTYGYPDGESTSPFVIRDNVAPEQYRSMDSRYNGFGIFGWGLYYKAQVIP